MNGMIRASHMKFLLLYCPVILLSYEYFLSNSIPRVVDNIQQSFYWVEVIKLYEIKLQRVSQN